MERKIRLYFLVAIFILTASILSCARNSFVQEKELEKVLVGTSSAATSAGFFIAKEKGYFEEQGIDADIRIFKSSTREILPLIAANHLDVGAGGLTPGLYNAINQGIRIKLVADKGKHKDSRSIIVSKKLYPEKLSKEILKGKSFSVVSKGTPSTIPLELFLERYGLTLNDIELYTMSFPNMNAALANGSLFGAVQVEPFVSLAIRDDIAVEIITSGELYPDQQVAAVFYSDGFMRNRKEITTKFMIAYLKGLRYYNDYQKGKVEKKEIFEILKKYTSIDDFELFKRIKSPAFNPNGYLNMDSIEKDLHWFYENGYIERIPGITEIVDNEFVEEALKIIGEYKKDTK